MKINDWIYIIFDTNRHKKKMAYNSQSIAYCTYSQFNTLSQWQIYCDDFITYKMIKCLIIKVLLNVYNDFEIIHYNNHSI